MKIIEDVYIGLYLGIKGKFQRWSLNSVEVLRRMPKSKVSRCFWGRHQERWMFQWKDEQQNHILKKE